MGKSDSADRDRKSKKKSRYRSRSRTRSSSNERGKRKRSRSRERKKSRSRSREKRRSRSRERRRSRSLSKDRSYRKDRKSLREKSSKHQSSDDDSTLIIHNKKTGSSSNLKDKIKALAVKTEIKDEKIIPSFEDISKIENDNFSQANFSSTNVNIPQQNTKKKKKGKKKGKLVDVKAPIAAAVPTISHESAMFGSTNDTMHIGKFASRINNERKELLKAVESNDLIFGAMFCEDPEIRMKRWNDKLISLRRKLTAQIDGEMMVF